MDLNEELVGKCLDVLDLRVAEMSRTVEFTPVQYGAEDFVMKKYYQVFESKNGFIPDLSIVDLIFNMGPESVLYLTNK